MSGPCCLLFARMVFCVQSVGHAPFEFGPSSFPSLSLFHLLILHSPTHKCLPYCPSRSARPSHSKNRPTGPPRGAVPKVQQPAASTASPPQCQSQPAIQGQSQALWMMSFPKQRRPSQPNTAGTQLPQIAKSKMKSSVTSGPSQNQTTSTMISALKTTPLITRTRQAMSRDPLSKLLMQNSARNRTSRGQVRQRPQKR